MSYDMICSDTGLGLADFNGVSVQAIRHELQKEFLHAKGVGDITKGNPEYRGHMWRDQEYTVLGPCSGCHDTGAMLSAGY